MSIAAFPQTAAPLHADVGPVHRSAFLLFSDANVNERNQRTSTRTPLVDPSLVVFLGTNTLRNSPTDWRQAKSTWNKTGPVFHSILCQEKLPGCRTASARIAHYAQQHVFVAAVSQNPLQQKVVLIWNRQIICRWQKSALHLLWSLHVIITLIETLQQMYVSWVLLQQQWEV